MLSPTEFSIFNKNTVQHARYFLSKYKDLFRWCRAENALEVGCAGGNVTQEVLYPFMENHVDHLLAVDISNEAIQTAKEANRNPKISFRQLDITDERQCEKYNGKFQHIFSFYCFQLIQETDLWSKNVSKMLAPGGQLFTYLIVNQVFYNEVLLAQKADKTKPWWKYINDKPNQFVNYGPKPIEMITNILATVGLRVERIDCELKYSTFSDKNNVKGTFASVNSYSKFIPEDLRGIYLEDYLDRAMKYVSVNNDGDYIYCFDVLSVLATKI